MEVTLAALFCYSRNIIVVFFPTYVLKLTLCSFILARAPNTAVPHLAWDYFEAHGVPTWECDPYVSGGGDSHTGDCPSQCKDNLFKAKLLSTHGYHSPSSIKAAIYADGPVTGTMEVYSDFMNYKSGVYSHKTGSLLGGMPGFVLFDN